MIIIIIIIMFTIFEYFVNTSCFLWVFWLNILPLIVVLYICMLIFFCWLCYYFVWITYRSISVYMVLFEYFVYTYCFFLKKYYVYLFSCFSILSVSVILSENCLLMFCKLFACLLYYYFVWICCLYGLFCLNILSLYFFFKTLSVFNFLFKYFVCTFCFVSKLGLFIIVL